MAPRKFKKPTLPYKLLKEFDAGELKPGKGKQGGFALRKDRRKAERATKKVRPQGRRDMNLRDQSQSPRVTVAKWGAQGKKFNRKELSENDEVTKVEDYPGEGDSLDGVLDEDSDERIGLKEEKEDQEKSSDEDEEVQDEGEEEEEEEEQEEEEEEDEPMKDLDQEKAVSKTLKNRLARDDREIADLEKRLGLKGRKIPKSFWEDGLGDLMEGLEPEKEQNSSGKNKRRAEEVEWLARKRRKAVEMQHDGKEDGEDESGLSGSDMHGESDGLELRDGESGCHDKFEGFTSDPKAAGPKKQTSQATRTRENPYIAPMSGHIVKYVPPPRRQESGSEAELNTRLRRQTQGLVNRITESNLVSILSDIEKLYRDNPRQLVTSCVVDLLLVQVCDAMSLPETLLILSAGFATAAYRLLGIEFGAQLIQEVVQRFDQHYKEAAPLASKPAGVTKQTSNLITFLSQLYSFQLIGSKLMFDYIRMLLDDFTELNAELLLRIIRLSGSSLRQDDPLALKDIVALIRPAVTKAGEQSISVRTKFMIETINDLKNNRMKTQAGAAAIIAEHTTRMKKTLGTLNARKLKAREPLRIGLNDIQESSKTGKWWLVGARWVGITSKDDRKRPEMDQDGRDGTDYDSDLPKSDDEGLGIPNLLEIARRQNLKTPAQQSIFVAIMSSVDYNDAYIRIQKLHLNKHRRGDIPTVILQCVGAESPYNPYYTLVADKLCSSDRKIRYSLQDSLWKFFRRLGQPIFADDGDDADEDPGLDMQHVVNVAMMLGSLVAKGTLGINLLKCLDMPYLQPKTKAFVEVMLVIIFRDAKGRSGKREEVLARIFTTENLVLARNLQWFIKKVVRKSDLVTSKDANRVKTGCKAALVALKLAS